jgi:hypothetical protein
MRSILKSVLELKLTWKYDIFQYLILRLLVLDPKLRNKLQESILDSAIAGNHAKLVDRYPTSSLL